MQLGEHLVLLTWADGDREFAADIHDIERVIPMVTVTPGRTHSPQPYLAGIIDVAGEIVPVFRLNELAAAGVFNPSDDLILVRRMDIRLAVVCTQLGDVRVTNSSEISRNEPGTGPVPDYVAAIVHDGGKLRFVPDWEVIAGMEREAAARG